MTTRETVKPAVTLDNRVDVYNYYENREAVPGAIARMSAQYEALLDPTVIVDEQVQRELAEVVASGRPMIFNMNHQHEHDTVLGAIALGRTAVSAALNKIFVLAKDELFKDPTMREKLDQVGGVPVFQPKKHRNYDRSFLLDAASRLQAVSINRAVKRHQHMFIHSEGERNITSDKNKVQAMRAMLGRVAFGLHDKGLEPVIVPIGVAYRDIENAQGAVVVIGSPRTELPETQKELNDLARDDLQELVDRGLYEIETLLAREATELASSS